MRGHASVPRKSPDSFTFLVCYQVTGLHIREHLVSSRTHAIPNFSENDWQFCNYGSMNFYFPPLPRLDSSWADSWVLRPFNLKTFAFGMCYKIEMVSQESTCILEHVSPPLRKLLYTQQSSSYKPSQDHESMLPIKQLSGSPYIKKSILVKLEN